MFSDPSSRWFEFNQMADRMTSRRIDKHADLRNLSGIYTGKDKFAKGVATNMVRKEFENKVPFTKAEVRKLINGYINLRIRTWLDLLAKQGLAAYIASFGTVVEMDENGEIVDYGEVNPEWSISEDRKNSPQTISSILDSDLLTLGQKRPPSMANLLHSGFHLHG